MATHKHVRNPEPHPLVFPTLDPPLTLEPAQVVRVPRDLDLPGVETVTAKAYKSDGTAPAHEPFTNPDLGETADLGVDSDGQLVPRPNPLTEDDYDRVVAEAAHEPHSAPDQA